MKFFALNLKAFKKISVLLFVASLITSQIDLYVSSQVENAIRDPRGLSNAVYLYGFLSMVISLIFPILLILICLFGLSEYEKPFSALVGFFKRYLNQMMIEILRSWGKILQWSLLLIIPGVIKYLFYTLVPFVVTESRTYDRGETDALEMSTRLVKKNFGWILLLVFIFHILIPGMLTSLFDEYRLLWQTPVACLLLNLLDTYLLLLGTQCFLLIFRKSLAEAP